MSDSGNGGSATPAVPAYQGDGKKRRSFLPAPKKSSGVSPTSVQAPSNAAGFQSEYTSSSSSSFASFSTSAKNTSSSSSVQSVGDREEASPLFTSRQPTDNTKSDKPSEEPPFGRGLRVGVRVKIGGVKPGILRYLGTTHLAPGIFCGIELFDPDGNHDGEVNGHRYFACQPNHGIFAPKEKVCLDTSTALGRLSSDSEGCYSSTESLSERTQKAFRSYEEGELEAIDCTKLSPILSPQEAISKYSEESSLSRQSHLSKLAGKSRVRPVSADAGDILRRSSDSLESQESGDSRRAKSGLPRAKSGLPTSSVSQSKLPTFSRAYNKYEDGQVSYQRSSSYTSQSTEVSGSKNLVAGTSADSDQEHKTGSAKSSEDSEEDGFVRDTLSTGIKKQLRADSRQYLNFTFDQEELNPALERDDSESDITRLAKYNASCGTTVNPLYSDPRFIKDISGDSSDESLGVLSPGVTSANSLFPSEQFMKLESGSVLIEGPAFVSLPSHSGPSPAVASESYTVVPANARQGLNMSVSSSETEEDVNALSVTRSISDSDLPPELLPNVDYRSADGLSADYGAYDERLSQGGYGFKLSGDGSSGGLNLTQTPDSRKSESYTIAQEHTASDINRSQSYTVCSHDEPPRDSKRKDRDIGVVASQSYTISKSDSATSSPSRKYRKISSSSSANEGGDSSSSGTEPKTDSSGENKGDNLDDSSTGVSPEVSQALEWDYGQEFDGKIPISQQDSTMTTSASTGTSESLSDVLRDVSEHSDGFDGEMLAEDSDQFEPPDNEFENIDSLEDFPIFGKDAASIMTDSGISDKDFEFCPNKSSSSTVCGNSSDECSREDDASSHTTTRAISSDSSQETLAAEYVADTPGSIEDKEFLSDEVCPSVQAVDSEEMSRVDSFEEGNSNSPASVVSMEEVRALQDKTLLCEDLEEGTGKDRHYSSHEDVSSSTDTSVVANDVLASGKTTLAASQAQAFVDPDGEEATYDSEGRALNRKERPISLISNTSADTGYAPDTDSEFGTLTSNTPDEWVDRLGITHPTSFAPLMETGIDDIVAQDLELVEEHGRATPTTMTAAPSTVTATKTSDDDDYCSDLTSAAEDERIEADQVYGPKDTEPNIPSSDIGEGSGRGGNEGEPVADSPNQGDQAVDGDTSMDTTGSVEKEENKDANKEGKGSNKEASNQQRKGRGRKPITITRKRSENVDHKLPDTTKVVSRLADYIKAPPPVKPKEEKEKEQKKKMSKNVKNAIQKRMSVTEISSNNKPKLDNDRSSSVDRAGEKQDVSAERQRIEKPEKPKPIIKRTPPKSRWGNIMSQIEANKDNTKVKPKTEIKSSLAAYLQAPLPQLPSATEDSNNVIVNVVKNDQPNQAKKEIKSRIKPLPPPPPKIDLSKVKSKLNVPTAASANKVMPRRDSSPTGKNRTAHRASRDASPAGHGTSKDKTGHQKRMSDGHIVLMRQSVGDTVSSAKSSRTDLSVCDSDSIAESRDEEDATPSKRGSVDITNKRDRRLSTNSVKSDHSEKTRTRRDSANHSTDKGPNKAQVKSTIPPFTPLKVPSRAIEIRIGDGSTASSARSSPTPIIIKPIKPKPKSVTPAKPAWGSGKPPTPPTASSIKGRNSGGNSSRKPRVNGTTKTATITTSSNQTRTASSSGTAQKEIVRLESLCEARTKELTHTKMQLKATTQGFDAMAVLVNYCCAELNAFECPVLALKLETVQKQLTDCLSQIADLSAQKETLDKNLSQVTQEKDEASKKAEEALSLVEKGKEEHVKHTQELDQTHNSALTTQRDELTRKHEDAVKKLHQYYDKQMDLMKQAFERQMADLKNENKLEVNGIRISHLEEIQELRNKHDSQMEELHKQHRNKLEDITHRFESIKLTLSEKVESLRGECDDLRHRARNSEEALQRDADVKVQMALAPFLSLPKEIESLKTVLEMRNEEIQKLRSRNMDLEKQMEEIPIAREKIISLQQKVENLEAIINIKTDHEKQLHEKCQVLMRKYDRESKANKRLSMDYEQVMWRMSQSSEFGGSTESLTKRHLSRSPQRSEDGSPDPRRRTLSPQDGISDVVMRVKKRSSHSISEGDRKLRSRSATFVVEKNESSDSHSPSSSPQPKQKRWRKKSQTEEVAESQKSDRMCHSAGAEILSDSARQEKEVVEHQQKVSGSGVEECQAQMTSSDMASSYARSLSGVSDSGVYDSLTRSDMLNSSIVSTDSEFGTSINLSMALDSTVDDVESGPPAGDYNTLNDTAVAQTRESSSEVDSGHTSSSNAHNGSVSSSNNHQTVTEYHTENSQTSNTYHFQVSLTDDNVFDDGSLQDSPDTITDTASAQNS